MKKYLKLFIILILMLAVCTLVSCAKKSTFEDIEITGNNVTNIAEGAYTLRYNIKNLAEYEKKNDVDINVVVTDNNNQQVNVVNKRVIIVEADNEYLVTILVTANQGNNIKSHNYTITAVKNAITVTFSSGNYKNFDSITRTVEYGMTLTDVPQVPAYTPTPISGYEITVTSSEWSRIDFNNLIQNITVYAEYQTSSGLASYTLTFVTNGGSAIAPLTDFYGSSINEPTPPTKNGFVFFGWYTDEDFKQDYTFGMMGTQNFSIYARWLEPIANATNESYFDFALNNQDWYTISAKDPNNMPQDLILPNVYNGKPVTKIAPAGFAKCHQVVNLTIPSSINEIGPFAFSGKRPTENQVEMNLESVTFMDNTDLIYIVSNCFSYNSNLLEVNIPSSVMTIDMQAFTQCSALTTVMFDEGSKLVHIRDEAFLGCSSLVTIDLPASLQRFSPKAFYDCIMLSEIIINSEHPPLLEEYDGFVFGYNDNGVSRRITTLTIYVVSDILNIYNAIFEYSAYNLEVIQD